MDLAPMEVTRRMPLLEARISEARLDALLVTNLVNIRYLTGFTGTAGMLLVPGTPGARPVLTTDGRYDEQARDQLGGTGVDVDIAVGGIAVQHQALRRCARSYSRVGLESESATWSLCTTMESSVFDGAEVVASAGLVEAGRMTKDSGERDRIGRAASIADDSLEEILDVLASRVRGTAPVTEREVALELDFAMRRRGADERAFETIVASGPCGARPHHRASTRTIGTGETVVIDFGAVVDGYRSDMTRTVCIGEPRDPVVARMFDVVAEAQRAGVAAVRAGVGACAVDAACRSVIADAGWAEYFVHGTGHGVGLDIHEAPWVGSTTQDLLADGSVLTVEPGVYIAPTGGVRIEDTVVVTDEGCDVLTRAPKVAVIE